MQESNDLYILLAILGGIVLMIIFTRIINAHSQIKYQFKPITLSRTLYTVLCLLLFIATVYVDDQTASLSDNPATWTGLLAMTMSIALLIYLCIKAHILLGVPSFVLLLGWGFLSTAGLVFVLAYLIYRMMGRDVEE
ncbi:MAG: hypothetical protein U5R06_02070 [candidate division KSB1 bacterium]|nr:hypothetical protein [candidate division KSB1 bacterium]